MNTSRFSLGRFYANVTPWLGCGPVIPAANQQHGIDRLAMAARPVADRYRHRMDGVAGDGDTAV